MIRHRFKVQFKQFFVCFWFVSFLLLFCLFVVGQFLFIFGFFRVGLLFFCRGGGGVKKIKFGYRSFKRCAGKSKIGWSKKKNS